MGLNDFKKGSSTSDGSGGSRRYVQPDKDDFEEFLSQFDVVWMEVDDANTRELVYETPEVMERNGVTLRIFSTIDVSTGRARGKGEDAIRTVMWDRHIDAPIGGRTKTLRIETWRKNLKEKIESIFDETSEYVNDCPECDGWLVKRDGQYGEFYGCTSYPECQHTEEVDDNE